MPDKRPPSKPPLTSWGRAARSGASYFAWVFGAGFLLGSVRVPFLVPRLGARLAELIEMPLMFAVIWFASSEVVRRFELPPNAPARLATGLIALVLLVAAELLLAVVVAQRSIGEYISSRDPVSGSVYLGMLAVFAMMPLLQWLGSRPRDGGL